MARMKLLTDVDGDEVSLVKRAANRRRFLLLKGDEQLDSELTDILEVPWEREGALLDEIRKDGITDEAVEKAVVAAVRLLKGVEGEFSPELVEKLGTELYGRKNPKINTGSGAGNGGELVDSAGTDEDGEGSASGPSKDGSGRDGELIGSGSAPKVATDSDEAEPDADDADGKKKKLFRKRVGKKAVSKADDEDSLDESDETTNDEGGTVEVQVPVRKEDGTWDLTGVPSESRPFFESMIEKADKTESELKETKEKLAKADETLRSREMVEKAAAYSHVAPTDDLAPILKSMAEALDEETFAKFETLLGAAEERITKGDLFTELGRSSKGDGAVKSDAWSEAVKKADEMVEKADQPLSQDQALTKVWEQNPDLYTKYLNESGMGVS